MRFECRIGITAGISHVYSFSVGLQAHYGDKSSNHTNIIQSDTPDLHLVEDKSYTEFLFNKFDTFGNKPAIIDGITGEQYTYPQIQELAIKLGSALIKRGFKKGDVCAIFCNNVAEYPIIYLGIIAVGGIATLVSSMATVSELSRHLKDTNAQYVFTVPAFATTAKEAAKQCGLKEIFVVGETEGFEPISKLFEDDGQGFPKDIEINPKEDAALLPYSSGTTGLPKGVMLTHFNLSSNIQLMVDSKEYMEISIEDKVMGLGPFYHMLGFNIILGPSMYCGSTVVSLPKFEQELFFETIQNFKISQLFAVPPMMLLLAKDPIVDKYDLSSLRTVLCGAAPLSKDLEILASERLENTNVRQGYGLSEATSGIAFVPIGKRRPGSSGKVIPNMEVKVTDVVTGKALGEDEEGEICTRGPQVMKGYLNNPQATREAIDSDGWLRTGDIGYYDSDRYFYVVDRSKELIKYKAYQVAPGELEAVLIAHPKIQDAAVIGIPDEECGELPKGFVVAKDLGKEEIHSYLEANAAPYKMLRGGIEYVDEIPKSLSGKILRRVLKEQELSK